MAPPSTGRRGGNKTVVDRRRRRVKDDDNGDDESSVSGDSHSDASVSGDSAARSVSTRSPSPVQGGEDENVKIQQRNPDTDLMRHGIAPASSGPEQPRTKLEDATAEAQSQAQAGRQPLADRRRVMDQEYKKKRDSDPTFIPNRGNFFMHDARSNSHHHRGQGGVHAGRGRGRGQSQGQFRGGPVNSRGQAGWVAFSFDLCVTDMGVESQTRSGRTICTRPSTSRCRRGTSVPWPQPSLDLWVVPLAVPHQHRLAKSPSESRCLARNRPRSFPTCPSFATSALPPTAPLCAATSRSGYPFRTASPATSSPVRRLPSYSCPGP